MKNFKETGITLIALVITIIILLILAGVTIGFAINGNGLFEKAKEAVEKYQNAQDYEEEQIAKLVNETDWYASLTRAGTESKNYSLNEQVVGTWIDGKTLYQKTIDLGSPYNGDKYVSHSINNPGIIMISSAWMYNSTTGDGLSLNYYESGDVYAYISMTTDVDELKIRLQTDDDWFPNNFDHTYVTLLYTKK